jgi:hypothetical protein
MGLRKYLQTSNQQSVVSIQRGKSERKRREEVAKDAKKAKSAERQGGGFGSEGGTEGTT